MTVGPIAQPDTFWGEYRPEGGEGGLRSAGANVRVSAIRVATQSRAGS